MGAIDAREPRHRVRLRARVAARADRAARQHRDPVVARRPFRGAERHRLRDDQARADRPHTLARARLRPCRRARERGVPGLGAHRDGRRADGRAARRARARDARGRLPARHARRAARPPGAARRSRRHGAVPGVAVCIDGHGHVAARRRRRIRRRSADDRIRALMPGATAPDELFRGLTDERQTAGLEELRRLRGRHRHEPAARDRCARRPRADVRAAGRRVRREFRRRPDALVATRRDRRHRLVRGDRSRARYVLRRRHVQEPAGRGADARVQHRDAARARHPVAHPQPRRSGRRAARRAGFPRRHDRRRPSRCGCIGHIGHSGRRARRDARSDRHAHAERLQPEPHVRAHVPELGALLLAMPRRRAARPRRRRSRDDLQVRRRSLRVHVPRVPDSGRVGVRVQLRGRPLDRQVSRRDGRRRDREPAGRLLHPQTVAGRLSGRCATDLRTIRCVPLTKSSPIITRRPTGAIPPR
ncbi:hypothetical protein BURPS1710b_0275 [Burkholderia pseudomallei 1710b]|uniref:Uncharacterized protein n=1 Tax=Burkholderia pseudomallei (strain 1710b) TaxID=320372 RepID=Q3JXL3_BURP1|nr:hypothetical protein BURPS1710b_0275 [Burkholderia pseudomallei 1710b]